MRSRIGINPGAVHLERERIHGDGVNVAARSGAGRGHHLAPDESVDLPPGRNTNVQRYGPLELIGREQDDHDSGQTGGVGATMSDARESFFERVNHARYRAGQTAGHYESFFQRANDPARVRAFWIRYTMISPEGRPPDALGELWAIFFDGEAGQHVAVKTEVPLAECVFRTSEFFVKVGDAWLGPSRLIGAAAARGHTIEWDLRFHGDARPLLLLPLELYDSEFLRAKALVGLPMAVYHGSLTVDGRTIDPAVRHAGTFEYFRWRFTSESDAVRIEGAIAAPGEAFVALTYHNPTGGTKHCLNSKIAACELRVTSKQDNASAHTEVLSTRHRAAFEILTDDRDHGVELRV